MLVTGGAGYIGSHAVLALLDTGRDVVVVDNLTTGFDWAVDPRATLVRANIEDDDAVRGAMRANGVVAVMHFAGSIIVPESVENPLKYYRNNTAASRCADRKRRRLRREAFHLQLHRRDLWHPRQGAGGGG